MDFDEIATVLHKLTAGDRGEGRHSGNEASDHKRTEHLEAKGVAAWSDLVRAANSTNDRCAPTVLFR